jgi:hypothetical protein
MAADVAGYSRLIGADEEGTLNRSKAIRAELIDPKIEEHQGRTVKTTGDGLLPRSRPIALKVAGCDFDGALDHPLVAMDILFQNADALGELGESLDSSIAISGRAGEGGLYRDHGNFILQVIRNLFDGACCQLVKLLQEAEEKEPRA